MTDKRLGREYNSMIHNITKRKNKQQTCMKRATNNPDYIYMLGNKCIKPMIKSRKHYKHHKMSNKHIKKRKNHKSRRVKYRHNGGGLYQNTINGINVFTSGIREINTPKNVLPWEGNFSTGYSSL
jgi:hypothetical protein